MGKVINGFYKGKRIHRRRGFLCEPPGFKRLWGSWASVFETIGAKKISFTDKYDNLIEADTTDPHSPYFGASMYEIINAYNNNAPIKGKIVGKCFYSNTNRFSGYEILIGRVITFMPRSQTVKELRDPDIIDFADEEKSREKSIIEVKIKEIDTKNYNIIVTSIF